MEGVEIFSYLGLEVRHALLAYDPKILEKVIEGKIKVIDEWGNEVGIYGALTDKNKFYLKKLD